jgi:hypothetical protein
MEQGLDDLDAAGPLAAAADAAGLVGWPRCGT